jgi:hypothetical protein
MEYSSAAVAPKSAEVGDPVGGSLAAQGIQLLFSTDARHRLQDRRIAT